MSRLSPAALTALAAATALAAVAAAPAEAASLTVGNLLTNGGALAPGEVMLLDFENALAPEASLLTGADLVSGGQYGLYTSSVSGIAAAPAGNTSRFLAVLGSGPNGSGPGAVTIDFGAGVRGFSFDAGSIDAYNTIELRFLGAGSGGPLGTGVWTGSDIINANFGSWTAASANRRLTFTAGAGETLVGVTLKSSQNSFEIDNVAVSAVPEPAMWATLLVGFGLIGATARRRRGLPSVCA